MSEVYATTVEKFVPLVPGTSSCTGAISGAAVDAAWELKGLMDWTL